MIGWEFIAGVVVGLVIPVIVVVGLALLQPIVRYVRERINGAKASYRRIRDDGPDTYIRIVEEDIDFSKTGRLERFTLYVFLLYAKLRTSGTIYGKNNSLIKIFDEEYGIDLDADEEGEWEDIITELRDMGYVTGTTISIRSPQEIHISKSEYTSHYEDLLRKSLDDRKSVIEQADHFVIAEPPTVDATTPYLRAEVTVKYTG